MRLSVLLLFFTMFTACAHAAPASPSPISTAVSGDQALRDFYGRALTGHARDALRTLAETADGGFTPQTLAQKQCVLASFDRATRAPLALGDLLADTVATAFRDYWSRGLLDVTSPAANEAELLAQLQKIFASAGAPPPTALDAATEALGPLLEKHGFHSLRGVTAPFYDLMLWRDENTVTYPVVLPESTLLVKVVLMRNFVLLGWSGFATCGAAHNGGWARDDALYCVADAYDQHSEDFAVSYLVHEAQHLADYRRFPKLQQADLEYRAKLTELATAKTTLMGLLELFARNASPSRDSPHAFADHEIIREMSLRVLGSSTPVSEGARWKLIAPTIINAAAVAALKDSSAALTKNQLSVQWRALATEAYKGKQDDIFFVTPTLGFYGNGLGKIFKTTDGGEHWRLVWTHKGTYVRALGFINEKHGFAGNIGTDYFPGVTDTTALYETRDGGDTWHAVKISGAPVKGLCAIDVLHVPAINAGVLADKVVLHAAGRVGGPTVLATSLDEGRTWTAQDMSAVAGMILDVKFVDRQTGFVCAGSSAEVEHSHAMVLKTVDGGKTWVKKYESPRLFEDAWKCAFPSAKVGYATVQSYDEKSTQRYVAKTSDGGDTWSELPLVSDAAVREFGIGFVDDKIGFVGAAPHGFQTRDGGESWTAIDFGNAVNKVRILTTADGVTGYAIGTQVYKFESR